MGREDVGLKEEKSKCCFGIYCAKTLKDSEFLVKNLTLRLSDWDKKNTLNMLFMRCKTKVQTVLENKRIKLTPDVPVIYCSVNKT
jgi:hypothetical protein